MKVVSIAGVAGGASCATRLPRLAIPYLKELRVTCLPVERIGR